MKITIGKTAEGKSVGFDLDELITTRLLIQANSGAGKSYLLRKLMEQLFGHIQVIAIDPEGEFATLREKYGFVLVGKGGETPADPRIAADVAEKLLELKASAVCDLYEMKPGDRHVWVKNFLDALVNAPKTLWHPVIVIVDEAHVFCPEKGAGDSVAKESMLDLSSRGRKRGFCPLWATQRLAKLDKDGTSNMLNRLVGGTFEDVDIKRALDLLSVVPEQKREMSARLRTLEPGMFYAFGRAIATERVLFRVGEVETSHPKPGSSKHAAAPPPAPEAIAKLLPSLADLPQAAEEKARTLTELHKQLRELKAENTRLQREQSKTVQAPKVDDKAMRAQIAAERETALRARDQQWEAPVRELLSRIATIKSAVETITGAARGLQFTPPKAAKVVLPAPGRKPDLLAREMHDALDRGYNKPTDSERRPAAKAEGNGVPEGLRPSHHKVLNRLAELLACTGSNEVRKEQLAAWSEYSPTGGGYGNLLGLLRSSGFIDYPRDGYVTLTEEGRAVAKPDSVPADSAEMLERAKSILGGSEARILEAVFMVYPESLSKVELAEKTGFSHEGGGYGNYLGHMRTLGFIDYPQKGYVRAADWLFLE